MKNLFYIPFIVFAFSCSTSATNTNAGDSAISKTKQVDTAQQVIPIDTNFHNGDIIFQTSNSGQSLAIQLATHSKYSHCGLVFSDDNINWFVYEAVQPVKKTPLKEWIDRGDNHYYAVERLKNADSLLTPTVIQKMRNYMRNNLGKNYDLAFDWSDEKMYCSEFVWKTYHDATGLNIGELKKLGDFDLSSPIVKKQLNDRYGKNIPLEEPMISPGNIFDCPLLIKVKG